MTHARRIHQEKEERHARSRDQHENSPEASLSVTGCPDTSRQETRVIRRILPNTATATKPLDGDCQMPWWLFPCSARIEAMVFGAPSRGLTGEKSQFASEWQTRPFFVPAFLGCVVEGAS